MVLERHRNKLPNCSSQPALSGLFMENTMTFVRAAFFAAGFTVRITWLVLLPVIGIAALLGVTLI